MTEQEEFVTEITMEIKEDIMQDDNCFRMGVSSSDQNGFGYQVACEHNEASHDTLNATGLTEEGVVTSVFDENTCGESQSKPMDDVDQDRFDLYAAEISLQVDSSELDMYLSDSDQSDHTKKTCPSHNEELTIKETEGLTIKETESPLHCALCGNLYTDPRILDCLHAYCYQCIEKCYQNDNKRPTWEFLRCPSCSAFQKVKDRNKLPKHLVLEKLVQLNESNEIGANCVVCALHEEERQSTGKCVDCDDLLCDSCCQKHTFSRLTAKHVIVPLDGNCSIPKRSKQSMCHEDEKIQEFKKDIDKKIHELEDAVVSVEKKDSCKEDLDLLEKLEEKQLDILRNGREKYIALVVDSYNASTKKLNTCFKQAKQRCINRTGFIGDRRKDVNNIRRAVNFIFSEGQIEEVMQMEKLLVNRIDNVKKNVKKTYHKVTSHSNLPQAEMCQELYDKLKAEPSFFKVEFVREKEQKERTRGHEQDKKLVNTVSSHQKSQPKAQGDSTGNVKNRNAPQYPNPKPRVPQGRGALLMSYRNLLHGATPGPLGMDENKHPSRNGDFDHFSDSQRNMQSSSFHQGGGGPNDGSKRTLRSALFKQGSRNMHAAPVQHGISEQDRFFVPDSKAHNGSFQQPVGQTSNWCSSANTRGSLLGEYPGPHGAMSASLSATQEKMFEAARVPSHSGRNVFDNFTDDQSYSYEHGQPRSFSGVELDRQTLLTSSSNTLPDPHMTVPVFKQRFAVDTHIDSDKRLPEIKGIVFTSQENFVVSDGRNQMLKAFSCSGAYLDFIADPGPMSVTFCNGWLMWNSQYSNIKFYNTKTAEVITNPSLSQTAPHPLTSCRNQTYLVGNVNKSSIEAYTVDVPGKLVLYMVPKGCDGRVINDVSAIATRNKNHLVVIDNFNKRVVINDLTGRFVGEFFKDDCEPSSVCITEHDQIFVTDIYRNKIILLNAHGRFIKEWGTLVERPSAIATNGKGTLAVGGAGRNVIIYEYRSN